MLYFGAGPVLQVAIINNYTYCLSTQPGSKRIPTLEFSHNLYGIQALNAV